MMADVLNRALYGGLIGSIGGQTSDTKNSIERGGIAEGQPDSTPVASVEAYGSGAGFLLLILLIGTAGIAVLAAGSLKNGRRKFLRNVSEMTGGLIGKKPREGEDNEHS